MAKEIKRKEEEQVEIDKYGYEYELLVRLPQKKLNLLDSLLAEQDFRVAANTINSEASAFRDFCDTQTKLIYLLSDNLTEKLQEVRNEINEIKAKLE